VPNPGIPISVDRQRALDRFQFYSRLPDCLDWARGLETNHLREFADSFSFDLLNLAVLAGRLIRYAGITPESYFTRHDIIDVTVDAEAYFVMLQTACDTMADVICTLAVSSKKRKQAPRESFHRLQNWAKDQLGSHQPRINVDYARIIARDFPWFTELNAIRTKLVHRGNTVWIYTEGCGFEWSLNGAGSQIRRGTDLLTSLQSLTRDMLNFSNELSLLVASDEELQSQPEKRIIDGLNVPAFHHLLDKYARPVDSENLILAAHSLMACRGYVEAAFIGYPDGFWWTSLMEISRALGRGMRASRVFVRSTGAISDCRFVFANSAGNFGIVATDIAKDDSEWRKGITESARALRDDYVTDGIVIVARRAEGDFPSHLEEFPTILSDDAQAVAKACLAGWRIPADEAS